MSWWSLVMRWVSWLGSVLWRWEVARTVWDPWLCGGGIKGGNKLTESLPKVVDAKARQGKPDDLLRRVVELVLGRPPPFAGVDALPELEVGQRRVRRHRVA